MIPDQKKLVNTLKYRLSGLLIFLMFNVYAEAVRAATVDTIVTYSTSMKKKIKAVIILPDNYAKTRAFSTVYLLHGYGGNYSDWVKNVPSIKNYADQYGLILVFPDGNVSSWYLDSPEDDKWKYETYISSELVKFIDETYKTRKDKGGRAITGLSMGGHGALYLAFKHQDVFGAAGSMSGGVDLRPFSGNWQLADRLGSYAKYPDRWRKNSVIEMIYLLAGSKLAIIFDCGKDDFFYYANLALHDKLLYNNIPHDFIVRPGAHNWAYWSNSVGFQLLYFNNFFQKNS